MMNMGRSKRTISSFSSSSSSWACIALFLQHLCVLALLVILSSGCDAREPYGASFHSQVASSVKTLKRFDVYLPLDSPNPNSQPYDVTSPLNYESLAPIPSPDDNNPPYCVYPPPSATLPSPGGGYIPSPSFPTPRSPPLIVPSPLEPVHSPPQIVPGPAEPVHSPPPIVPSPSPPPIVPSPSEPVQSPPQTVPSPTVPVQSPPLIVPSPGEPAISPPPRFPSPNEPGVSPPQFVPTPTRPFVSPPYINPSPSEPVPSPPQAGGPFMPPVVYPPPTVPPPPSTTPPTALWCVAKPAVPEPIIQEAMNYACASGADCDQIQPNGACFQPDTLFAHASYAFNSYWQRTKQAGGTCEFGSTAMLVTVDPSYDGCHFTYM